MRKFAFVLIMVIFVTSMAMAAQETEKAESPWGFEVGISSASVKSEETGKASGYIVFEGGANYVLEHFFFDGTFSYTKKQVDSGAKTTWMAFTLKANYRISDGFYAGIHYGFRPAKTEHSSGHISTGTMSGPGIQLGMGIIGNLAAEFTYSWGKVIQDNVPDYEVRITGIGVRYFF